MTWLENPIEAIVLFHIFLSYSFGTRFVNCDPSHYFEADHEPNLSGERFPNYLFWYLVVVVVVVVVVVIFSW